MNLSEFFGIEFKVMEPQKVVATMPVDQRHHQPFGFLHGGDNVVLAETVASSGGFLNCRPGQQVFGLEINANHLRSKKSGLLTATGVPLHVGGRTQVWQIEIRDEAQRLISVARCTLAVVEPRAEEP